MGGVGQSWVEQFSKMFCFSMRLLLLLVGCKWSYEGEELPSSGGRKAPERWNAAVDQLSL